MAERHRPSIPPQGTAEGCRPHDDMLPIRQRAMQASSLAMGGGAEAGDKHAPAVPQVNRQVWMKPQAHACSYV